ncbi:MAG: GNAT family N-acetyltransferase [Anaerolineales bacterium]|nr:GNAT family N-acetyltransferase [Anaerolineales bacterium]
MPHQLETERLILRPFTPDAIPAAVPLFEGNPEVWQYDPGFARTCEQRAAIIQKYATSNEEKGVGTVVNPRRDCEIGRLGSC